MRALRVYVAALPVLGLFMHTRDALGQNGQQVMLIRGDTVHAFPYMQGEVALFEQLHNLQRVNLEIGKVVRTFEARGALPDLSSSARPASVRNLQWIMAGMVHSIQNACNAQSTPNNAFLGVEVLQKDVEEDPVDAQTRERAYPVVLRVVEGSPAKRAGIDSGDVIAGVNGVDLRTESLAKFIKRPGEKLDLKLDRGGQTIRVTVQLARSRSVASEVCASSEVELERSFKYDSVIARALTVKRALPHPVPVSSQGVSVRARRAGDSSAVAVGTGSVVYFRESPALRWSGAAAANYYMFLGAVFFNGSQAVLRQRGVTNGVPVLQVEIGSVAHKAGLRATDVVVGIGGKTAVGSLAELKAALDAERRSKAVEFDIVREGKRMTASLDLNR